MPKKRTKTTVTKKAAARPHATPSPPAGGALHAGARAPAVRVRMYRQGLGDCFLVTFDVGGDERHMLIDCGTLGNKATEMSLADAVADIAATTRSRAGDKGRLHLLIATHEHKDHVSAFNSQAKAFGAFKVDNVWLAWTEDPGDPLARKLAKSKADLGNAVHAAFRASSPDSDIHMQLDGLLGFYHDNPLGAASLRETINQAMRFVRTSVGDHVAFLKPGSPPLEPGFIPGFRFYVLGPPYDRDALGDLGEHGSSQLYGMAAALRAAAGREDGSFGDAEAPFDAHFCGSEEAAARWFAGYFNPADHWRRADDDWLRVTTDLALQLDDMTNNSSLALAIERLADGKVLLFPADAQQGNWLSWHDPKMKWTVADGAGGSRAVTAVDLLARTVFYKVGHHSSHNATARAKGLELMTQEQELTAFIPVDRAIALSRNPPGSWKMPFRPLYRRLLEKCRGRVVRSDLGWAADAAGATDKKTEQEFVGLASPAEWTKWAAAQKAAENAKHVTMKGGFVDYRLD